MASVSPVVIQGNRSASTDTSAPSTAALVHVRPVDVGSRAPRPHNLRWIGSAIVFLVAAGVTFLLILMTGRFRVHTSPVTVAAPSQPAAAPAPASLGLRVDAKDDRLLISWDRASKSARDAQTAVLNIVDGQRRRTLKMDAVEFAHGSVIYKPSSDDVEVRLALAGSNGRELTEAVRILGAQTASVTGTHEVSRTVSVPAPERPLASPNGNAQDSLPKSSALEKKPAEVIASNTVALPADLPALPVPVFSRTPLVVSNLQANTASQSEQLKRPSQVIPAPAPKTFSVPAQPVVQYIPPKPLRKPTPSPAVMSGLYANVDVNVIVRIDDRGHVASARIAEPRGNANPLLIQASLAAAKQWTFEPAQLRDKAVPSDYVILFRFARHGR